MSKNLLNQNTSIRSLDGLVKYAGSGPNNVGRQFMTSSQTFMSRSFPTSVPNSGGARAGAASTSGSMDSGSKSRHIFESSTRHGYSSRSGSSSSRSNIISIPEQTGHLYTDRTSTDNEKELLIVLPLGYTINRGTPDSPISISSASPPSSPIIQGRRDTAPVKPEPRTPSPRHTRRNTITHQHLSTQTQNPRPHPPHPHPQSQTQSIRATLFYKFITLIDFLAFLTILLSIPAVLSWLFRYRVPTTTATEICQQGDGLSFVCRTMDKIGEMVDPYLRSYIVGALN